MKLNIDRNVAEWLVDLLEDADHSNEGTWRIDLSDHIRGKFGMGQMENYDEIRGSAISTILSKKD